MSLKTSITFGMIYVPVKLHASIKENDLGFNMLEKNTMSRVKYQKTCVDCDGKLVEQNDLVRAYQYEKGKYVTFEDSDFEKLKQEKDKNITILQFVDLLDVDPIYFNRAYYVEPLGGERAYNLLLRAMHEENKAGIAKTVLGTKETLAVLRVQNGEMLVNTLYFYEELRKPSFNLPKVETDEKELSLAKMIIANLEGKFEPQDYKDEYTARLQQAIEAKINGQEIAVPKAKMSAGAKSLMEALQATLNNLQT
jgi:DNA end-binding protein Ku